jgi:hypothetical protein
VVVVVVVVVGGGEAAACAGANIELTTGFDHLLGKMSAVATPPMMTFNTCLRLWCASFIETLVGSASRRLQRLPAPPWRVAGFPRTDSILHCLALRLSPCGCAKDTRCGDCANQRAEIGLVQDRREIPP